MHRHTKSSMKHLRAKPWNKNKTGFIYLCAVLLFLFSFLFGILCGATELGLSELTDILFFGDAESPAARIFLYVRFPGVLAAFSYGAALAVSGGVIQGACQPSCFARHHRCECRSGACGENLKYTGILSFWFSFLRKKRSFAQILNVPGSRYTRDTVCLLPG